MFRLFFAMRIGREGDNPGRLWRSGALGRLTAGPLSWELRKSEETERGRAPGGCSSHGLLIALTKEQCGLAS